ncbi:MAG: DUF5060 domain-containing protein, partial [Candidatus Eisenbacteria bacterium]|nr:DUF5060 domain-containing protein [Candidatus Latescibacterota bacterium]MBD3303005.1 DUF5060 domain-containing protein [Candidatus Eisenbacteria bacterium]
MAPTARTLHRYPWGAAILVGVLVLAARIPWLHRLGLHWDEDISSLAARGILQTGLPTFLSDRLYWRAPLYHYLVAPFVASGVDWVPRILSIGLAVLSGFLMIRLGRRVLGDRAALIGALLFAISLVEISLSRQIRMYALYQPLALLALYALYHLWRSGEMRWAWRSAGLILLSMTTHQLGATLAILYIPLAVHVTNRRARAFCAAAVPAFVGLGLLQRSLIQSTFAGERAGIVEPLLLADALVPERLRVLIGGDPLFLSREVLGAAAALGLIALAARAGVLLGLHGSRGQPRFLRLAGMFGLTLALGAAGGAQIGVALAILFLLILQRERLFPQRRGAHALAGGILLALAAGIGWLIPSLAGGYAAQDYLLGVLRVPGRFLQTLLWPPFIGWIGAVVVLAVAARAWKGRAPGGILFLVIALSWSIVARSMMSSAVQTRYLTELWPLWELVAGYGIVVFLGASEGSEAGSLRRKLGPVTGIVLVFAALLLPGTGVRQTIAFLSRNHGESVYAGYQLRTIVPDLRSAGEWLEPRLAPADRVVATDWLTTYFYVGRVDGWLRSQTYRWQSVRSGGVVRDCYIGAEVVPTLEALQAFLERGPTWVVVQGTEIAREETNITPEIREWLRDRDPAWIAEEGQTRVYRFGADRPVLQLPGEPVDVSITAGPPIDTPAPSSAAVPRFGTAEVVLDAGRTFDAASGTPNPFVGVALEATVTAPSGRAREVAGFFDGDGRGGARGSVFKLRICPDEAGPWRWETRSDLPELDGRRGAFLCEGGLPGRFGQGPLVVDPEHPRAFRLREGDP